MRTSFLDILREWQNFYFMLGGAAATLIGLLFVAVSLGSHLISRDTQADIELFVTPILFYFISVLVTAMVMLVPLPSAAVLAVVLLCIGAVGLSWITWIIWHMLHAMQRVPVDRGHWIWHAIVPCLSYVLIGSTGIWLLLDETTTALLGPTLASALLLISGIWRAWDLILWIGHQRVG